MKRNNKVINAWCTYDMANSVYNLVINTAIFPIYYTAVTSVNNTDKVSFFGIEVVNSVLYSYAISFSYLISAALLPILSGIADYTGKKKNYLKLFTYIGASACIGLVFFKDVNTIEWGILCVVLASIGYSSGLVFYDAFLPEIAPKNMADRISARGYSFGYAGSVVLLLISIVITQIPEQLGFSDVGQATRFVFILVGLWWIGFAQIPFRLLPDSSYHQKINRDIFKNGYRAMKKVFYKLRELTHMKIYLIAFFFYNMGVQTIMLLAILFGTKELQLGAAELIPAIIIIQFVAILGAILFARLSDYRGNIFSLSMMILIWIGICIYGYGVTEVYQFYIVAGLVGLVMGGIQSLSRATFSKLIPNDSDDHTSFFSFYDVTFHISVVLGTFAYGLIDQLTGSMRNSILVLALFFIIGLAFLVFVKVPHEKSQTSES
jgi:MFS transporter, UMF1 family|tara:strand:+ start:11112 stop:12413 length:1302 start_codon:yes stop_codon:yes gene_type:complete